MTSMKQTPLVAALLWALLLFAALFFVWPLWRAFFPLEIEPNEGWNAYLADMAVGPGPLYPAPDELIGNSYPPVSFFLIGGMSQLLGDAVYVGRALSLLATLALSVAAAVIVHLFGAKRPAAIVSGAWFAATMARFYERYVGMNDPQLLAQMVMAGGLCWFIWRRNTKRAVEPAVLMMVLAGFIKHNIIAIPISSLIWLTIEDWSKGLRAILVGAAAAAAGLLLCVWLFGPNFVADLQQPRVYHLMGALSSVRGAYYWFVGLLVWAFWAWSERRSSASRFTLLLIGISLLSYVIQRSGEGIDYNSQFDLVFGIAVGLGFAFEHLPRLFERKGWSPTFIRALIILVLLLRLIASPRLEFAYVLFSPEYRAVAASNSAVARAEAARIASVSHPVGCDSLMICRMAGKAYVFDRFKVSQMIATGRYSSQEIMARLNTQHVTIETIDPRARADSLNVRINN